MPTPKFAAAYRILILSLAFIGAPASGETAPFPPPPVMPSRQGMSDADYSAARDKWRDAYSKWEGSLTPEQLLVHKDAEEKKYRRSETSIAHALKRRLPQPGDGYAWKTAAEKRELAAPIISQLEKNQFAYGPSVKQSFEPYLDGPVYITSDSLLNAFHVLFEDSFREVEFRNVDPLRTRLERLLADAKKIIATNKLPQNRMEAALRHAQRVLGPAILLLGGSLEELDPALQGEITAQIEIIREANSSGLPVWLGPPDPQTLLTLDYRRCKPVGFYAASDKLSGYFRAVRWLQMIPFRSGRPGEFDAAVLLNLATRQSNEELERSRQELLGSPDDLTINDVLTEYSHLLKKPLDETSYDAELDRLRVTLTRYLVTQHHSAINFDLRARQTPLQTLASQLTFRVLSPTRLADAVLFQNLIDQRQKPRGLAVAALLGSPFAQRQLADDEKKVVEKIRIQIATEKESGEWWSSPQIYANYLDTLNALFLPPAADAPTFMKTEAWEAKNCQTALGGWAQMRHTFTLQAKTNVTFFGLVMVPPGFVEDNPEFFARMARLVDKCHDLFANNECFDPRKPDESEKTTDEGKVIMGEANEPSLRARWLLLGRIAHSLESLAHKQSRRQPWTESEETFLHTYGDEIAYVMGYFGNSWLAPHDDAPRWAEVNRDPAREKSLVAAIGRPRTLYVLYPWNGIQVLCTGSVMQYYEYESTQRLTDHEWLQLLDSPQAPAMPLWLGKEAPPPSAPLSKKGH